REWRPRASSGRRKWRRHYSSVNPDLRIYRCPVRLSTVLSGLGARARAVVLHLATPMAEVSRNLILARGPENVWDRQATTPYDRERWIAAACGSALSMIGARRGGFAGGLLATLGGTITVRAALGRHDYRMVRHWANGLLTQSGWGTRDIVD